MTYVVVLLLRQVNLDAMRSALCAMPLLDPLDFHRPKKAVGLDHQDDDQPEGEIFIEWVQVMSPP